MDIGPIRTCTGCRARRRQDALIRMVRAPEGVVVAKGRRAEGRGAYVCKDAACVDAALGSGALQRALRYGGDLPAGLRSELLREVAEERRGKGGTSEAPWRRGSPEKGADGQT